MKLNELPLDEKYPFSSDEYYDCWWHYLSPKFNIKNKNKYTALIHQPFFKNLLKLKQIRLAGWNSSLSEIAPSDSFEQFEQIASNSAWDFLTWDTVYPKQNEHLIQALRKQGFNIYTFPSPSHYSVDISHGYEKFMAEKSSKKRKNIRIKLDKAVALQPKLIQEYDVKAVEPFFETFFEHHIPYWNKKNGSSYFNCEYERKFIVAWAKELARKEQLLLQYFSLNNEPANLSMSIATESYQYYALTINTGAYLDYLPGIVSLYHRIQEAENLNFKYFLMGYGDYQYKLQAANVEQTGTSFFVPNPKSLPATGYLMYLTKRMETSNTNQSRLKTILSLPKPPLYSPSTIRYSLPQNSV